MITPPYRIESHVEGYYVILPDGDYIDIYGRKVSYDLKIRPDLFFRNEVDAVTEAEIYISKLIQGQFKANEAIDLLRELVAHLSYDAGVNGSKFSDHPYGRISLSTKQSDHLFYRMLKISGIADAEEVESIISGLVFKSLNEKIN